MNDSGCQVCPRRCGAHREKTRGYCGAGAETVVSGMMLHHWEEPCISGDPARGRGSGAVFFAGCPLRCVFCQNAGISRTADAAAPGSRVFSDRALADEFLRLEAEGAYNLNLVSPTQFTDAILRALELCRSRLTIPVVWNTGGYERPETIRRLTGFADVFLTDFKYGSASTAGRYAKAPDYPETAAAALAEMLAVTGAPVYDDFPDAAPGNAGRLRRGVILRHLLLPGERRDSMDALRLVARTVPPRQVILSLMRQYTPDFAPRDDPAFRNLTRRVTSFEYDSVQEEALRLEFSGYGQDAGSARCRYTPDFARAKDPAAQKQSF